MKTKHFISVALVSAAALQLPVFGQTPPPTNSLPKSTVVFSDRMDKVSYCMGVDMAGMMREVPDIKVDMVVAGVRDMLEKKMPAVSPEELKTLLTAFEKEMRQREQENSKELARKNKEEGEKFLAANKIKEGVKTLPSGLQYKVIKEGSGAIPQSEDSISVNVSGALINGVEFMNTFKRNTPLTVRMQDPLIKGWKEALSLMKAGSKWQLVIPTDLAWGDKGGGREIPANATVISELELVEVKPASAPAAK